MTKALPLRADFGGQGTQGKKIALKANFFKVKMNTKKSIYHYDVEVNKVPNLGRELPKKLCEQVVQQYISDYENVVFKQCSAAYDSRKNIYTSEKIPESIIPPRTRKSFEVQYRKPGGNGTEAFEVKLRFAQEIPLENISKALKGKEELDLVAIQALDIVLMHGFKMNDAYTSVGRNFFLKQQKQAKELGVGREIWFGFHQSLRPCEGTMMLNIDVAATTFYKGQPLVTYASQILFPLGFKRRDGPPPKQKGMVPKLDERQKKMLEKELKSVKIETTHGEHRRHYKIAKLTNYTARTHKFETDEGTTTVQKYFETKYRIRLRFPDLPLVLMLPREKNIQLPMELCYVLGGEHYKKKLDPQGTSDMVRSCAKPAPDRAKIIDNYARTNNYSGDQTIQDFNLRVDNKMVELEGRILPSRKMITKQGKNEVVTEPRRGVWQTDKSSYFEAQHIKKWTLYCAENEKFLDQCCLKDFVKKIQKGGQMVGMNIDAPISPKYLNSVDEVERAMREARDNDFQIVLFILGDRNGTPFYNRIKQVGDVKFGVRSQCITARNVKRANNQLIGNVLLKINAKLNGVNNIVKNPDGTPLLCKPTMIIGADVTHPAPGDNNRPSVAAVCASMNASATVYHSEIRVQAHRQETIGSIDDGKSAHLEDSMVALLKTFYRSTRQKPEHLIYYRDGVSEGQFQEVLKHELKQIRRACKKLSENYRPKLTFLVCQKRHHARMFCQNERDADGKSQNIPAGTIVDSVITHPVEFDFYLCSHAGIQGTSRPTHYHVLYNNDETIAESPDVLQGLTYSLCHVYQRCQRSVSIPAPVYYAHLVAYRATVHLQDVDDGGSSTYSGDDNITLTSEVSKNHKNVKNCLKNVQKMSHKCPKKSPT